MTAPRGLTVVARAGESRDPEAVLELARGHSWVLQVSGAHRTRFVYAAGGDLRQLVREHGSSELRGPERVSEADLWGPVARETAALYLRPRPDYQPPAAMTTDEAVAADGGRHDSVPAAAPLALLSLAETSVSGPRVMALGAMFIVLVVFFGWITLTWRQA